jgi:DUF2934 family protein
MAQPAAGTALAKTTKVEIEGTAKVPTQEEISARAYLLWQKRGGAGGSSEEDWLCAEQELKAERAGVN